MKKDRVKMLMEVTFKYGNQEFEEDVWIPFPILINAIRKFFDMGLVKIDGTDNAIWNTFIELDCLDKIEDNKEIQDYCRELYKGSSFEEEDYEDWKDDYEFDHNLGQYAEED